MIEEFRFSLDFNSPAFLSEVPRGKERVEFLKKIPNTGQFERKEAQPDHYPADPRGIRIPSLRGVLEFWYRALQGAATSQEVFDRQARVFGSAEGGQGLSIRPTGMPKFESGELCFNERDETPFPFLYLGYGPLQLLRIPEQSGATRGPQVATSYHEKQARDAIKVSDSQRGRFRFAARGTSAQIEALKRALTLLHLFGGLGSRSRRGWGSVEVTADGIQPPKGTVKPAEWIASTLTGIWSASQYPAGMSDPAFSALSSGTRIYVTRPIEGDYREVLRWFFDRFQAVRSYQKPGSVGVADHDLEVSDLRGGSITRAPERLAFGMPFQPGHGRMWTMQYRGTPRGGDARENDVSRRASPLLLKVLRLGPRQHCGVALFLQSQFFGNPNLEIGAVGMKGTQPVPGYGAIDQFLSAPGWTRVPLP